MPASQAVRKISAASPQDALVEQHTSLVRRIAFHLITRLPPSVQVDDLIQAGMIGLLEASGNYASGHGASFETFAGIRIRGAMLDEIRKSDWTPRSLHRKLRQIAEAIRDIETAESRDARDSEVAEKLGLSLEAYHQVLQDASGHRIFSLEDLIAGSESVSEGLSGRFDDPLEDLEHEQFRNMLAKAIAGLPEREKLVMALYYDEELNLRQIGEVLNVSESRVCQIHGQAVVRLRARLKEWAERDALID